MPVTMHASRRGGFLPSDDALLYPYHVPANAMAVVELRATATVLQKVRLL